MRQPQHVLSTSANHGGETVQHHLVTELPHGEGECFKGNMLNLLPLLHQVPDMSLSACLVTASFPDSLDCLQVQMSQGVNQDPLSALLPARLECA